MTIRIVGVLLEYLEVNFPRVSLAVLPISFQSYPMGIKIQERSSPSKVSTDLLFDFQISTNLFILYVSYGGVFCRHSENKYLICYHWDINFICNYYIDHLKLKCLKIKKY